MITTAGTVRECIFDDMYSCAASVADGALSDPHFLPMQMLGADLQAHKVIYGNNPVLKWCLTNTGVQTGRNGNIVPIKNQSPKQRIDGTA